MDPDNQDIFQPTPDRLSEFSRAVMMGDPAGAAIAARKATETPMSDGVAVLIGVVGLLYALSAVLRQLRLWTQPLVDQAARGMGGHHKPVDRRFDPDPADREERDRA